MKKIFVLLVVVAATATLAFADQKTVDCGSTVTIKATPAEHYHLVSWSNGAPASQLQQTVTVEEAMTITATFAPDNTYTLTLNTSGAGAGAVNIIAGEKVAYYAGDEVTIQAVPADGCQEFLYWEDDHNNKTAIRTITFAEANLSYTAVFGVKQLKVTITAGEGGSVQFVEE